MNLTLGIDCSSVEMGLGLCDGPRAVAGFSRYAGSSHAEHIAGAVRFILSSAGACPADISRVGVAVGPGSFTGLRIALSFVKGFLFDQPVPVVPVSSLECVAGAWTGAGRVVVCFDARRGEVFWAAFSRNGTVTKRLSEDCLGPVEQMISSLSPTDTVLTDTLGYERSTLSAALSSTPNAFTLEQHPCQRGVSCALCAAAEPQTSQRLTTALALEPRYLRVTYAEEQRQRGLL